MGADEQQLRLTDRQQQIAERLGGLSDALGDLFRTALREMNAREGSAWIRIAGHACREIVNRLPEYLDVPVLKGRLEYTSRVADIAEKWRSDSAESPSEVALAEIDRLVADHREVARRNRRNAESLFAHLEAGEPRGEGDARAALWVSMQNYFHQVAHLPAPGAAEPDIATFERYFSRLEQLLGSQLRAEEFYASQADLDVLISKDDPTEEDADQAVALMRGELRRSFFERASARGWLPLLRARGYFRTAPATIADAQYTRFPSWPEARYLVAIADKDPEGVAGVIADMSPTDNARVHADLLDAILRMPPSVSKRLVRRVADWLGDSFLMIVPDRVATLIGDLAASGEIREAAWLARQFLLLRKTPARSASFGENFEVGARVDEWEYLEFLRRSFKQLLEAAPTDALCIVRDVLGVAARFEREKWGLERDDGLKVARNRIDQPESHPAFANALISALTDAAIAVVESGRLSAEDVLVLLRGRSDLIFRRIELHLADRLHADVAITSRRELILDDDLYANYSVEAEYDALLRSSFLNMEDSDRQSVIDRIEGGPPDDYREVMARRLEGEESPTQQELEERWEEWRYRKLLPIAQYLDGELAARHASRAERFEASLESDDFSREWVGPTAELGPDELDAMSEDAVFGLLRTWEPEGGWHAATREGQGRALAAAVERSPDEWLERAQRFVETPPIYARHFFAGIEGALRGGAVIGRWNEIVALAEYVVAQGPGDSESSSFDDDADYAPSSRTLGHLVEMALSRDSIPFALRDPIWGIISILAAHEDPSLERDRQAKDAAALGLNSTRPIALRAAMGYALWCARNLDDAYQSMEQIPEVAALLGDRLAPGTTHRRSEHAVFGQFLPYLFGLDENWTARNLDQIFPSEEEFSGLQHAAWSAFVRFAPWHRATVEHLLPEFERAVSNLDPADEEQHSRDQNSQLSEYVSRLHLEQVNGADAIIDRFFERAPVVQREHATRFYGLMLRRMRLTHEQRDRAEALWRARIGALDDGDRELFEFGWWFTAESLDASTTLGLLDETLQKSGGRITNLKEVVARVARIVSASPRATLSVLNHMAEGTEWYELDYALDELRTSVEALKAVGDHEIDDGVRVLINALGERAVHGLRDLL